MAKRKLPSSNGDELSKGMWINPRSNLKRGSEAAWDKHSPLSTNARLIELADIALGLKKPQQRRKAVAATAGATHEAGSKKEPYTG